MQKHIDETERSRHDLRHHLSVIEDFLHTNDTQRLTDYLVEYKNSIPKLKMVYCEHVLVNSIVNYYVARADELQIKMDIGLALPSKIEILDTDLCIIFGNSLENALEACSFLPNERRFITLKSKIVGATLSIVIVNSFDGISSKQGDIFLSRKRNGEGIGISSINAIVHKYNGDVFFEAEENVFTVKIALPAYSFVQ